MLVYFHMLDEKPFIQIALTGIVKNISIHCNINLSYIISKNINYIGP